MYPNTVCHAVLALLSEGYPPLEGRSPTCYSPVCHSNQGLLPFRVRLACVRHAASVDSEPGSNSQVKFIVLPTTSRWQSGATFNPSQPVELALSDSCYVKCRWFTLGRSCDPLWCHPLILDGLCACTFYLVFKEPSFFAPPLRVGLRLGEPSNCMIRAHRCQPKCSLL